MVARSTSYTSTAFLLFGAAAAVGLAVTGASMELPDFAAGCGPFATFRQYLAFGVKTWSFFSIAIGGLLTVVLFACRPWQRQVGHVISIVAPPLVLIAPVAFACGVLDLIAQAADISTVASRGSVPGFVNSPTLTMISNVGWQRHLLLAWAALALLNWALGFDRAFRTPVPHRCFGCQSELPAGQAKCMECGISRDGVVT